MISLLASIVLSTADGGTPFPVNDAGTPLPAIYGSCPAAPPVTVLDGGWILLPPERAARNACMLAACEFDRKEKEHQLETISPNVVVVVVAIGLAVGVSGTVGYFIGRKTVTGR